MGLASRLVPPLLVMGLIFALSAQPNLGTELGVLDTVLRKLAHVVLYALLWIAVLRATGYARPVLATVIGLAYAVSDELHQTLVAGRAGLPSDVAIDALGMGLAALAYVVWRRAYSQPRSVASRTA